VRLLFGRKWLRVVWIIRRAAMFDIDRVRLYIERQVRDRDR
jgi:hypothetical protein